MFTPSYEQIEIERQSRVSNVIVDAVPGSGKTSTILYIAEKSPDKRTLVLTYNGGLRHETRERAELRNIAAEIHTYHSFCNKHYMTCNTDEGIIRVTEQNISSHVNDMATTGVLPAIRQYGIKPHLQYEFDIILIDEVQDATPLYFAFIKVILLNHRVMPRVCVFGDVNQEINGYNGADARFLTRFDALTGIFAARLSLSTSFRLTRRTALFITDIMLGGARTINTVTEGTMPLYYIINTFDARDVYNTVFLPNTFNHKYSDVFILANSVTVQGNAISPIAKFANYLTSQRIPIYVANTDQRIDAEVIRGKVCISTFHQTKGLERKIVIVFGFDNFLECNNVATCPNALYVACSRASEQLIVIEDVARQPLPFLDMTKIVKPESIVRYQKEIQEARGSESKQSIRAIPISEFGRRLEPYLADKISALIMSNVIRAPAARLQLNSKVYHGGLTEIVADINGVAIPAYFELRETGNTFIGRPDNKSPGSLLRQATKYIVNSSKYRYKIKQIKHFDWLDKFTLDLACDRLKSLFTVGAKLVFEHPVCSTEFSGRIDCIEFIARQKIMNIYEFKCCELDIGHKIQLLHYVKMMKEREPRLLIRGFLYNIINDNLVELQCDSMGDVIEMIKEAAQNADKISDDEFIEAHRMTH